MARALLQVVVQPRARRSEIAGWHGGRLRVRLVSPPVGGAANRELVELIAEALGVARSQVSIARGPKSRQKTLAVEGLSSEELATRLPPR